MCENKRKAVSKFIFYKYTVMILSVIYVCVRSVCAFVHMYMIVRARARVFVCVRAFVYMYMIVCVCVRACLSIFLCLHDRCSKCVFKTSKRSMYAFCKKPLSFISTYKVRERWKRVGW